MLTQEQTVIKDFVTYGDPGTFSKKCMVNCISFCAEVLAKYFHSLKPRILLPGFLKQ